MKTRPNLLLKEISKERLAEIEAMREEDIDTSDIPEVDEAFFQNARAVMPTNVSKNPV